MDVLRATYSDLKTVKTRSVCQLVLELPIEQLTDVVSLLGAPVPGNEVWVAVARLRPELEPEQLSAPRGPAKLAAQAAMLCQEPGFQRWLETDAEGAADAVRLRCGVKSRADLDGNETAARAFRDMRADYRLWLNGVAA